MGNNSAVNKQPWLGFPWIEFLFILLPPFLSIAIIALFPAFFQNNDQLPEAAWVVLILLIDVGHVYSTLFRTYFDKQALKEQSTLLIAIPVIAFTIGVLLYSFSSLLFWRVLAYTAVFHFVRQQYGFLRIYSRRDPIKKWLRNFETFFIYWLTIYPLLYWHLSGPRNFNWFVENDFLYINVGPILTVLNLLYVISITIYLSILVLERIKKDPAIFNWPKFLIISGTGLSWFIGIVYFNGDMAFTLLNVVSHGIPYVALVWIYGKKKYGTESKSGSFLKLIFSQYGWLLLIALLILFAFIEEGLWDGLVWKERATVFPVFQWNLPAFSDATLRLLIPFLAVPQITHYILDGFIWRIRSEEFKWKSETVESTANN
ncbi:MAG: hypothetical protein K2P88_03720 [Chitinophagaceae bacterium]|nr:hypothetical protein [Chitinophagaceae bacterium]